MLVESFEVLPADIDETRPGDESALDYVRRMAQQKAAAIVAGLGSEQGPFWVLGADTAVVLGHQCLGKPVDEAEAIDMLQRLSNRAHHVLSSVALMNQDGSVQTLVNDTRVLFSALPLDWIKCYAASREPMDKAGGYGIQGIAAAWIHRIEGSHTGVMGLPLFETACLLRQHGLIA